MNILLITVPSRRGRGGFNLPLGLIYVGAIIERCGGEARIVDPYLEDLELKGFDNGDFGQITRAIEDFNPSIVGFSGIASSYGRTKKLSSHIKTHYPGIMQIVGGALASTYKYLLNKTDIDVVFHGEAEVSLPIFLEKLKNDESPYDTSGISYLKDGKVYKSPASAQIENMDEIPFPAYHLLDMPRYIISANDLLDSYQLMIKANTVYSDIPERIRDKKYVQMITARGCTHTCSFCYRHVRGVRQNSVPYVIRHIKYLQERYGVDGFNFSEELFNVRPKWVLEFCDAVEKETPGIFYLVAAARVDKADERILRRLKESGCVEIAYGQESGSDKILNEYKKGITGEQNRTTTLLTQKMGILSTVQLVIGSPGETTDTIKETIKFLKDVDVPPFSFNYLIALPETPIWEFVEKNGLVKDVEAYLDDVAEYGGTALVNMTSVPDGVWRNWELRIRSETRLCQQKKDHPRSFFLYKAMYTLSNTALAVLSPKKIDLLRRYLPAWVTSLYKQH